MNFIVSYLFDSKKQSRETTWFRNALYLFLLYRLLIYSTQFKLLFSDESLIFHAKRFTGIFSDKAYLLTNYYSVTLGITVLVLLATILVLGLLKKSNYFFHFLLWIGFINLHYFLYPTLTAGDYLINQLLFFNIFFNPSVSKNLKLNDLKIAFHNIALIGIKAQICLAYLFAAWFKLTDVSWLNGTAIYSTFQIPEYSNAFLACLPMAVCMILAYATLFYQFLFPALIWARPFKIYLMAFGIVQHLLIAFGMGLFSFGIVMIICYILFLKYDD